MFSPVFFGDRGRLMQYLHDARISRFLGPCEKWWRDRLLYARVLDITGIKIRQNMENSWSKVHA